MANTKRWLLIAGALLIATVIVRPMTARGGDVDPNLVGKWRLQSAGAPVYWEINADGTYRVFGDGLTGHSGTFRAASGKWSLKSSTWGLDGGAYQLLNANTLTGVGKMGPATWVRANQATASNHSRSARRSGGMTAKEEADYITDYNAQWDKAAEGLRRLTTRAPRSSGSGGDWTPGSYSSSGSGDNSAAEAAARAEYEQRAVESRAYWGGSSEDYSRIQNGECNSSDNSRYGC